MESEKEVKDGVGWEQTSLKGTKLGMRTKVLEGTEVGVGFRIWTDSDGVDMEGLESEISGVNTGVSGVS